MNAYSPGSGEPPARYMATSLLSCFSASDIASMEPSASPSGFSCVVTRKRSPARIASAARARSVAIVVVWGELIDQLGHAHAALDRRIVFEGQLRRPLHPQLARDARLEKPVRRLESAQ